jgi:peptide/nickel transport system permease protein
MRTYVVRRLLQAFPTLLGVTIISFALTRLAPGDPVLLMTFDPHMTAETREILRHQLCLDRNEVEQYFIWLLGNEECSTRGLIRGDFGESFYEKRPALDMIIEKIPATLELTGTALFFGLLIGVGIGIYSAVRQGTAFDNISRVFAVVGQAIPTFWLGLIMILVFAVILGWMPVGGRYTLSLEGSKNIFDHLKHLAMPAFVLALFWIAILSRYMRTEMLEVIRQDYMRAARAKGVPKRKTYFWHGMRNALIPLVTILGPALAGLLGGALIVERIFSWPGMGRLAVDAVFQRDFPLVMATVMVGAALVILGNLLSDVLYSVVDPRIRLK